MNVFNLVILFIVSTVSPIRGDGDIVRQFFWTDKTVTIHTRKVMDVRYQWDRLVYGGTSVTLTYPEALKELSAGWLQPGKNYTYEDFACLSSRWPGGAVVVVKEEPKKETVDVDPSVITAIFAALQSGRDPNRCIEMLRLAMDGNNLLQTVTISTIDRLNYHQPTCKLINTGNFAFLWKKEVTLLDALLDGRTRCEKCKPVEVSP